MDPCASWSSRLRITIVANLALVPDRLQGTDASTEALRNGLSGARRIYSSVILVAMINCDA